MVICTYIESSIMNNLTVRQSAYETNIKIAETGKLGRSLLSNLRYLGVQALYYCILDILPLSQFYVKL